MKLSVWAKREGITYQTAWRMFKAGRLPMSAKQYPTGTIIVDERPAEEGVALYARVSSHEQKKDLEAQLGRLAAVIGIPKEVLLVAPLQSPDLLRVQVARQGAVVECLPGQGYNLVATVDGTAVRFAGDCLLQPDDVWDIRYLANP